MIHQLRKKQLDKKPLRKAHCFLGATLAFYLLCTSLPSYAQQALEKSDVTQIIHSHYNAKILKIKRTGSYFKVKLLTDKGRVKQVLVNAQSGEISSTEKNK